MFRLSDSSTVDYKHNTGQMNNITIYYTGFEIVRLSKTCHNFSGQVECCTWLSGRQVILLLNCIYSTLAFHELSTNRQWPWCFLHTSGWVPITFSGRLIIKQIHSWLLPRIAMESRLKLPKKKTQLLLVTDKWKAKKDYDLAKRVRRFHASCVVAKLRRFIAHVVFVLQSEHPWSCRQGQLFDWHKQLPVSISQGPWIYGIAHAWDVVGGGSGRKNSNGIYGRVDATQPKQDSVSKAGNQVSDGTWFSQARSTCDYYQAA